MKKSEFVAVLSNIPKPPVAVFELTKIPSWMKHAGFEVGEEVVMDVYNRMYNPRTNLNLSVSPSYLKFIGYR